MFKKIVFRLLEEEGKVENLGRTYRGYSSSAKQTSNTQILNFVDKVKEIYPDTVLTRGAKGGLDTATLTINKKGDN